MKLFDFLSSVIDPFRKLVDDVHTSDEEKLKLSNELSKMTFAIQSEVLRYETELLRSQSNIVTAEAKGESWLQRNWRPITMLTFLALVVLDSFGWLPNPLAGDAWDLLKIGLGGYLIGRSAEKGVKFFNKPPAQ